ncbi:hypothetical protein EON65_57625, partial [archaeon]
MCSSTLLLQAHNIFRTPWSWQGHSSAPHQGRVLPVPPPAVRPSISVDGTSQGMRSEDDLTYKLSDIIRANSNVKRCEQEGSPQHVVEEFISLLQYHVATYMDNDI